jgi:adenine-specific DNA-methyltransferase
MNQDLTQTLQNQITLLQSKLNSLLEGGGIKIFFPDKLIAKQIIRKVNPRILKELPKYSLNPLNSPNLILEGDNLHALASLYKYRNKIDLILTDPPYNTGKDFRYNDKQNKLPNDEELGDLIKSDDPAKHTKWMKFMLPRLILMKEMLKSTGVLAICIGEQELFNLGKMLDEVFGEENRIAIINWQKAYAPKLSLHVSSATDYVLVYAKDLEKTKTGKLTQTEAQKTRFTNPDNDPKGPWRSTTSLIKMLNKRQIYAIQNPFSGELYYPFKGNSWRYSRKTMKPLLEEWGSEYEEKELNDGNVPGLILKGFDLKNLENPSQDPVFQQAKAKAQSIYNKKPWPRLIYLKKGFGKIRFKLYFAGVAKGVVPLTWWDYKLETKDVSFHHQVSGHSQAGTAELKTRVDFKGDFVGIKPLKLFLKILQLWCPPSGLVLDPFAGSGTTGEAVLQLNKETNSNRHFILIEQGNPKNGDSFSRTLLVPRLQAIITGQWADQKPHSPLPGSFKYLKLTKQINSQTLLEMEREELTEAILSTQLDAVPLSGNYLIAKNPQNEGIFLLWNSTRKSPQTPKNLTKLRESQLSEKTYRQILLERKSHHLASTCHIYARTSVYSPSSVIFHKIPDHLLSDFNISPEEGLKKTKWTK